MSAKPKKTGTPGPDKRTGRKPGAKKAPPLQASTLCALARRWTIGEGAPKPSARQTREAAAATSSTIDPRLVELLMTIESTRGDRLLRELHQDELDDLARVSRVAASVGDHGFFAQAAMGMELAAKCGGKPVRLDVLKAWIEARKISDKPQLSDIRAAVKYRLGRIDPDSPPGKLMVIEGHIEDYTIRDHLKAMRLPYDSRLSGRK